MKQHLKAEQERLSATNMEDEDETVLPRLKVQWKQPKAGDRGYTRDSLMEIFEKYGEVTALVMSSKRRALVEFANFDAANKVQQSETGFSNNPLQISWINKPENNSSTMHTLAAKSESEKPMDIGSDRDYESIVLMRLRQAQERKRLIEQMKDDDANDTQIKLD